MLSDMMIDNVYEFVNNIGLVSKQQIIRMFEENHNTETIEWSIKQLILQCKINYDAKKQLLTKRGLLSSQDYRQKLRQKAAWLLSAMGEDEVVDYCVLPYPMQLLIITKDNTVYDVTTFTDDMLDGLILTLPRRWDAMIKVPDEMDDETVHIALLENENMAERVGKLKLFDTYCILDKDNKPQYFEWS